MGTDGDIEVCGCGQSRKNILFVGGTGNGKTELIKSILRYAGDEGKAATLKSGNNNISQTSEVAVYSAKIYFRAHHLSDRAGQPADFAQNLSAKKQEKLVYREDYTDEHIHLNMIDTPGLGDSNNYKSAEALFKHKSSAELRNLKIVDEKHKFAVTTALVDAQTIHAVCFLVMRDASFSGSFLEQVRNYLDIFQRAGLHAQYHVAHTWVTPRDRHDGEMYERENEFEHQFGLSASHHFLDSLPDPQKVVEVFCSRLALDEFLRRVSKRNPHKVDDIDFPKSQAQRLIEVDIRASIDVALDSIKTQSSKLREDLDSVEFEMSILHNQERKCSEQRSEKAKEVQKYDCEDLVVIPPRHEKSVNLLQILAFKRTIEFDEPVALTIREIERTQTPDDFVYAECKGEGTNRLQARLVPSGYFQSATAVITCKGYKKDYFAAELKRCRTELETIREEHKAIKGEIACLVNSMSEIRKELSFMSLRKSVLEADMKRTSNESISVKNSRQQCLFFTVFNVVGTAMAYGLESEVDRKLLPTDENTERESLVQLVQERSRQRAMLDVADKIISRLSKDFAAITLGMELLRKAQSLTEVAVTKIASNERQEAVVRQMQHLNLPVLHADVRPHLESLKVWWSARYDTVLELERSHMEGSVTSVQQTQHQISTLSAALKAHRDIVADRWEIWKVSKQRFETSLAAVEETIRLLRSPRIPLGAYTYLRMAIDERHSHKMDPYLRLYREIFIAFTIRDSINSK